MRISRTGALSGLVVSLLSFTILNGTPQGTTFTYQGRLSGSDGPTTGWYDLNFQLFDLSNNGLELASIEKNAVPVNNGLFSVALDFGSSNYFDANPRWLQISVRTNGEAGWPVTLSPRQQLTASPYAIHSKTATFANSTSWAGLTGIPEGFLDGNDDGTIYIAGPGLSLSGGTFGLDTNFTDARYVQAVVAGPNITIATNGSAYLISNPTGVTQENYPGLTPFQFGAAGDGIVDDTAALQEWLNACQASNVWAILPPARGPYYRITEALYVTNGIRGLKLVGTGGQMHVGGGVLTRAKIQQTGFNKHGIVITNLGNSGVTDSIHIEGIAVAASSLSTDTWGIAFAGDNSDTDCNLIIGCAVTGFGKGIYFGAAADTTILNCSIGANADGIFTSLTDSRGNLSILNSLRVAGSQLSYNYSNQIHMHAGKLIVDTCDIASVFPQSRGVFVEWWGSIVLRECNFEHHGDFPAVSGSSASRSVTISLEGGGITNYKNPTPNTYSVAFTNCRVTINDTTLNATASDGIPVLEVDTATGHPLLLSSKTVRSKYIIPGVVTMTNFTANYIRMNLGGPLPLNPLNFGAGLLSWAERIGGVPQTELYASAHMGSYYGSNDPVQIPLLAYAKDKATSMTVNHLNAGNVNAGGSLTLNCANNLLFRTNAWLAALTSAIKEDGSANWQQVSGPGTGAFYGYTLPPFDFQKHLQWAVPTSALAGTNQLVTLYVSSTNSQTISGLLQLSGVGVDGVGTFDQVTPFLTTPDGTNLVAMTGVLHYTGITNPIIWLRAGVLAGFHNGTITLLGARIESW